MVSAPAARIAWGAALTLLPHTILRCLPQTPPSPAGRATVCALGVRHVLQGIATARGALPPAWGTVPDALHAAGLAGVALRSDRWRTAALTDFCVACAFALGSLRASGADRIGLRVYEPRPR